MITVQSVSKFYGDFKALDNINFEVKNGDIVGLLGPNGAGKSTTMKIIAGALIPNEGSVLIDDQDIRSNTLEAKLKLGYMPEANPLYTDMLVKDALALVLGLHFISKNEHSDLIDKTVEAIGLKNVYYKPISQLSKGYKQRVGLAQALVHDPEILILDEPTEGLDPIQRFEIRALIKKLSKNKTIILSTHVMQEVEAMCNKLIVISEGKIILDGSKEKIINQELGTGWITLTVEGKDVLKKLQSLKLDDINEKESSKLSTSLRIKTNDPKKFYTNFSKLVADNNWVVTNLTMEKRNLEDLFKKLTKGEIKPVENKSIESKTPHKKKVKVKFV